MAHSPMVSGRSKIMEFEGILSKRLGVGMKFRKGRDNNKSFEAARKMIDGNQPVLIYADAFSCAGHTFLYSLFFKACFQIKRILHGIVPGIFFQIHSVILYRDTFLFQ